jgi:hypothetical protein
MADSSKAFFCWEAGMLGCKRAKRRLKVQGSKLKENWNIA